MTIYEHEAAGSRWTPLTAQLDQLADVVPPQGPGYPHGGRVTAVVHWLARPAVLDLPAGQQNLQEDVEVQPGAEHVVHHHDGSQLERLVWSHQPGASETHQQVEGRDSHGGHRTPHQAPRLHPGVSDGHEIVVILQPRQ